MSTQQEQAPPAEGRPKREQGFGEKRRGRGGPRKGGRRGPRKDSWVPVTKLGRLVKGRCIDNIEQIFEQSLPIKEYQVVDYFFKQNKLEDEVMDISPVQKQTTAGQRTRFKAYVVIGDSIRHAGLGIKCSAEVSTAIRGAIILAKLSIIPVRLGYWGNKFQKPHTIPMKLTGKCGSVRVRLIPAPRGTGIVASPVPKKLLQLGGVTDCFTSSVGHTKTLGNFVQAVFDALKQTYTFLTPDLWGSVETKASLYDQHNDFLTKPKETKPRRGGRRDGRRDGRRGRRDGGRREGGRREGGRREGAPRRAPRPSNN